MGFVIEGDAGLFARFEHGFIMHRPDPRDATVFFTRQEAMAHNDHYGRKIGKVIAYDQALSSRWANVSRPEPMSV